MRLRDYLDEEPIGSAVFTWAADKLQLWSQRVSCAQNSLVGLAQFPRYMAALQALTERASVDEDCPFEIGDILHLNYQAGNGTQGIPQDGYVLGRSRVRSIGWVFLADVNGTLVIVRPREAMTEGVACYYWIKYQESL